MKKFILFIFLFIFFACFEASLALSNECYTQEQLESEVVKERKKWDINDDNIYGLEEVIYALKLISGFNIKDGIVYLEGTDIINYPVEVYNSSGSTLLSTPAYTFQPFDLSPGNYMLKVNGTTHEVTVKSGENSNIKVGTVYLEGTDTINYPVEVYDPSGSTLLSTPAYTFQPIDLLPGNHLLKVNGTTKEITVEPGENSNIKIGVIKNSTIYINCMVYQTTDTTGESITNFNTNYNFDIFPGIYTFLCNDISKTIEIQPGENILNF